MSDSPASGKEYKLENAYEYSVMRIVKKQIAQDPDMCKCEKCYLDVCALVFNNGFSKYVTSEKGVLFTSLDSVVEGREVALLVETLTAIDTVKKSPAH